MIPAQLDRAQSAVRQSGMPFRILDEHVETVSGQVSISTMHLAKGLEFRAVAVMACDDLPGQDHLDRRVVVAGSGSRIRFLLSHRTKLPRAGEQNHPA